MMVLKQKRVLFTSHFILAVRYKLITPNLFVAKLEITFGLLLKYYFKLAPTNQL